jgi:hypothetical protein
VFPRLLAYDSFDFHVAYPMVLSVTRSPSSRIQGLVSHNLPLTSVSDLERTFLSFLVPPRGFLVELARLSQDSQCIGKGMKVK